MSCANDYDLSHNIVAELNKIKEKLDDLYDQAAPLDAQDAIGDLCDQCDDAIGEVQNLIDDIDNQGGVNAVDEAMAAEARMDAEREER